MLPYRLRKKTMVYLILEGLASVGGKASASSFIPGGLGSAAAKGWINIVDGWAVLTSLGQAVHEDNKIASVEDEL